MGDVKVICMEATYRVQKGLEGMILGGPTVLVLSRLPNL